MSRPTILVVDDESFFRQVFSDILSEEGLYRVETAASGSEAMERLKSGNYDIVLSDLVMPEVSGLDLLRLTRSLNPSPDVILATSSTSVEMAVQALKNGARDYLLKPCSPEHLKHIIRSCLVQRRLLNENSLLKSQIHLYQQGQSLATQLDVATLLGDCLQVLLQELGSGRGCCFLEENDQVSLTLYCQSLNETSARALIKHLAPRIALMDRVSLLQADELAGPVPGFDDLRSAWVLPLTAANNFRGAVILCNSVGEELPADLPGKNLGFLTEQIALGFKNACQYEGAKGLIYTDDLTGLYNYRYLQTALSQEIRRAERYGLVFSVVFIDLDMFKNINDRHGHLVGSDLLKEVAAHLKTCIREADLLFRYGGDEFTALLIETDSQGAAIVSERFRSTVQALEYRTVQGEVCRLTATVGHATFPLHATTQAKLIDLADKAMYLGKRVRNVTRSATELSEASSAPGPDNGDGDKPSPSQMRR
jgi:two-component system, cell cycle response regulator